VISLENKLNVEDLNETGSGVFSEEYVLYNLQVEWGLTSEQFNNEPIEKILKILQYKQAEAVGQSKRK